MAAENKRFAFTKRRLEAIKPPAEGRIYYQDETEGLHLCVTASGAKSFYLVKWHNGRKVRYLIGRFPTVTVEQARATCREKLVAVAKGIDIQAVKSAAREEPILADLWESYLELYAKPRKRTWQDDERMYRKYMPELHNKRLSAITKPLIAKWHGQLAKDHGPIQANRCKALLATMFSKASDKIGYAGANPCIGVASFPEQSRERFLLPAEMQAFFAALAQEDPYWQAFFLLCLFTGSRRGNVASMAWQEIDLDNAVWHIPSGKTKNKRPMTTSLCAPALAILQARYEQRNGSQWVFPAAKGDGHLIDPRKAWNRVLGAMRQCPQCNEIIGMGEMVEKKLRVKDRNYQCPKCKTPLPPAEPMDLHIHDLRRTQGSWQAAMGISLAIIGKSLGHADLKSTQVYSRLQLDPVKDAVSRASTAFLEAAKATIGSSGLVIDASSTAADPASVEKQGAA